MTTPANPAIQKILSDPNFLKLSGSDQVAVLKHLQSGAAAPAPESFADFLAKNQGGSYMSMSPTGVLTSPKIPASTQAAVIGSGVAPELLPAMEGGGLLGFLGRLFGKSALTGAGAGAGKMTGEAVSGDNPFSNQNLQDTAKLAGVTAAFSLPFNFLGELPGTKVGRALINKSMGATGRDMTYANPARAINSEDITDVATGDWNAYQQALRAGKTPQEAAQAAGGRFASVSQRVNELTPRLNNVLAQSSAKIPVQTVIDAPLEKATIDIIKNPALGDTEKMTAITKLGELQKSLKEGLGAEMTPQQAQVIKQAIGDRVNWGGTSAVTDDVKQVYRDLYGSLKNAIHKSVPASEVLDNRLTDLLGAMSDLETAAKGGESGKIPFTLTGMTESGIGHVLPAAANVAPAAVPVGATIGQQLQSKGVPQPQVNAPALPFKPGAGISKPRPQSQ